MIRIAITGPESCGKTSLAEDLAAHYKTEFVPEFSRQFLTQKNGKYTFEDLEEIAKGQIAAIEKSESKEILIVDTEMIVMTIWSQVVFGKTSGYIVDALSKQQFDLYVLCDTDVPWTYDPLRENEYDRDDLFRRYYKKLRDLKLNFIIVNGNEEERLKKVISEIEKI